MPYKNNFNLQLIQLSSSVVNRIMELNALVPSLCFGSRGFKCSLQSPSLLKFLPKHSQRSLHSAFSTSLPHIVPYPFGYFAFCTDQNNNRRDHFSFSLHSVLSKKIKKKQLGCILGFSQVNLLCFFFYETVTLILARFTQTDTQHYFECCCFALIEPCQYLSSLSLQPFLRTWENKKKVGFLPVK